MPQSLWGAKAVSAALLGSSSFSCVCWSFTFSGVGVVLVTGWWPLLRLLVLDSSDARLHLHDALASDSTPISGQCWLLACGGWGLSLVVLPP